MEAGQLSSTTAKFAANIEAPAIMSSALKSNKKEAENMRVNHKIISALKGEIVRMEKQLAKKLARVEKVKQNLESAAYYSKQAELVQEKIEDYQKLISSLEKEMTQEKIFFEEIFQVLDGLRVGSIYNTEQSDIARIRAMIRDKLANSCEVIAVEKMDQLIELVRLSEWVISNSSRQTVVNMIGYQKRIRAKLDELGIKRILG